MKKFGYLIENSDEGWFTALHIGALFNVFSGKYHDRKLTKYLFEMNAFFANEFGRIIL